MPYVLRDGSGLIQRISMRALAGGEVLRHDHPDVVAFLKARNQDPKEIEDGLAELCETDAEMARAIEDLITVLLKKNVIKMSDLPRPVQDRITKRVKLRVQIEEIYERASRGDAPGSSTGSPTISTAAAVN
jgi:ribonucleotide reductase alpha subunit